MLSLNQPFAAKDREWVGDGEAAKCLVALLLTKWNGDRIQFAADEADYGGLEFSYFRDVWPEAWRELKRIGRTSDQGRWSDKYPWLK